MIKLFMAVINSNRKSKTVSFSVDFTFACEKRFELTFNVKSLVGFHLGRLQPCVRNFSLGWKLLSVTRILAY
jgi:hypothetical protein